MDHLIGPRIRQLRKERNLTQAAFVGPNISSGYLSLIEKGLRNPSAKALEHIAATLGVDIQSITGANPSSLGDSDRAEIDLLKTLLDIGDISSFQTRSEDAGSELRASLAFKTLLARAEGEKGNMLSAFTLLEKISRKELHAEAPIDVWEYVNTYSRFSTLIGNQSEAVYRLREILDKTDKTNRGDLSALISCVLASKLSELEDHASAFRLLYEARLSLKSRGSNFVEARILWSEAASCFNKGDFAQAISLSNRARILIVEEKEKAPLDRLDALLINCLIYYAKASTQELSFGLELVQSKLFELHEDKTQESQATLLETQKIELLSRIGRQKEALRLTEKVLASDFIPPIDLPLLLLLKCELTLAAGDHSFDAHIMEQSINSLIPMAKTVSLKRIAQRQIRLCLQNGLPLLANRAFEWYSDRDPSSLFFTNTYLEVE